MARTTRPSRRTRRRLLPRAERRQVLLHAAAAAFARTGYAATSMHDIAAAAGITRLVVYRHFAGKEALYRSVLQGAFSRFAVALRGTPEPGGYGVGARALLAAARADEDGFRLLWRHACREARFARYADALRRQAVAAARRALADRVPAESLEWANGPPTPSSATWSRPSSTGSSSAIRIATSSSRPPPTTPCGRGCTPGRTRRAHRPTCAGRRSVSIRSEFVGKA